MIERWREGERVLQRMRECIFEISTAVRESISDRHKSGDFNVRERVSQREERSAGREYRIQASAGIFKQSMGARNRAGIGLVYRPARLHSLVELVPWNRFLGSIKV